MIRLLIALMLLTTQILATEASDVLDKTIEQYQNMNSFYAEFEQVYCDEEAGICQRFEGRTYYMRPNYFRMEIADPEQIYVGDSTSLWIYFPAENRVIRQGLEQMPFQVSPDALFADYKSDYEAEIVVENDEYYEIDLTPIENTSIYRKLTVRIKVKTYELIGITVYDDAGTESKFEFNKVEMNKKLSKSIFQFSPPEGVQVDEF
ncbi:MAG: outer membrane lipoprotein chaperone LolA [candidate division WOR-3 bacterium]